MDVDRDAAAGAGCGGERGGCADGGGSAEGGDEQGARDDGLLHIFPVVRRAGPIPARSPLSGGPVNEALTGTCAGGRAAPGPAGQTCSAGAGRRGRRIAGCPAQVAAGHRHRRHRGLRAQAAQRAGQTRTVAAPSSTLAIEPDDGETPGAAE